MKASEELASQQNQKEEAVQGWGAVSLKAEKERKLFLQTEPWQSKGAGEKILSLFLEGLLWFYNGNDLKRVRWKQRVIWGVV